MLFRYPKRRATDLCTPKNGLVQTRMLVNAVIFGVVRLIRWKDHHFILFTPEIACCTFNLEPGPSYYCTL